MQVLTLVVSAEEEAAVWCTLYANGLLTRSPALCVAL